MDHPPIPPAAEDAAKVVVGCALRVHRALGPGLLESVYEVCLSHELDKAGCAHDRQLFLPVHYDGLRLDAGLRIDLLVANELVVELKAVEHVLPVHRAQIMTYLKLTGKRLGLLINFNVPMIKDGIQRVVL